MKIEIKHLVPYLPYGLNVTFEADEHEHTLVGLVNWSNEIMVLSPFSDYGRTNIKNCKPILRPLSDLTKEIEMPFGKIVPMEWMFKENWTEWDGESDCPLFMKHTYLCASGKVFPNFLPFWIVEQLAEMHFDLFGLIENGLAIDINDIKN